MALSADEKMEAVYKALTDAPQPLRTLSAKLGSDPTTVFQILDRLAIAGRARRVDLPRPLLGNTNQPRKAWALPLPPAR